MQTKALGIELKISAPATLAEAIAGGATEERVLECSCQYILSHITATKLRSVGAAYLNSHSGIKRNTETVDGKVVFTEKEDAYAKRVKDTVSAEEWATLSSEIQVKWAKEGLDQISHAASTRGGGVPKELKPFVADATARIEKNGKDWYVKVLSKYDTSVEAFDDEGDPSDDGIMVLARVLKKKADEAAASM